jgi:hypothetical protein
MGTKLPLACFGPPHQRTHRDAANLLRPHRPRHAPAPAVPRCLRPFTSRLRHLTRQFAPALSAVAWHGPCGGTRRGPAGRLAGARGHHQLAEDHLVFPEIGNRPIVGALGPPPGARHHPALDVAVGNQRGGPRLGRGKNEARGHDPRRARLPHPSRGRPSALGRKWLEAGPGPAAGQRHWRPGPMPGADGWYKRCNAARRRPGVLPPRGPRGEQAKENPAGGESLRRARPLAVAIPRGEARGRRLPVGSGSRLRRRRRPARRPARWPAARPALGGGAPGRAGPWGRAQPRSSRAPRGSGRPPSGRRRRPPRQRVGSRHGRRRHAAGHLGQDGCRDRPPSARAGRVREGIGLFSASYRGRA